MSSLLSYSVQQAATSGPPTAAIIGAAVGLTVIIAISSFIYLDIRRRRFRKIHKKRLRSIKAETVIRTPTNNPLSTAASWKPQKIR